MNREEALLFDMADAVAALVLRSPRDDFARSLGIGADGTPTKVVDDMAEKEILRILEEDGAKLDVLSEEAGHIDRGGSATLVIDPIDGTTNAIRGVPLYCVSLAVADGPLSSVRTGLVRNIPTGDVYLGRRKGGAFLNGQRIAARRFDPESAILSPTLGEHARPEALHLAQTRYHVRSLGSAALEMCFVGQGALDLYYFAPEKLRVTDIAASTLIVREAGGLVRNASGKDLDMATSLAPRSSVVAAGSEETLHMLEVFH